MKITINNLYGKLQYVKLIYPPNGEPYEVFVTPDYDAYLGCSEVIGCFATVKEALLVGEAVRTWCNIENLRRYYERKQKIEEIKKEPVANKKQVESRRARLGELTYAEQNWYDWYLSMVTKEW